MLAVAIGVAGVWATIAASRTATKAEAVEIARAQYREARTLFDDGFYDKALELVTDNVNMDPDEPGSHTLRGRLLLRKGKWIEAIPELEAGVCLSSLQSNRMMCRINLSIAHFMLRDMRACLRVLDEMLDAQPKHSLALRWKALAWTSIGNAGGALEFARGAYSLKPHVIANIATLGVVQARSGDLGSARRTLAKVLKEKPDSAEDYYYLGLLHCALSDVGEAERTFDFAAVRDERFATRRAEDVLATPGILAIVEQA